MIERGEAIITELDRHDVRIEDRVHEPEVRVRVEKVAIDDWQALAVARYVVVAKTDAPAPSQHDQRQGAAASICGGDGRCIAVHRPSLAQSSKARSASPVTTSVGVGGRRFAISATSARTMRVLTRLCAIPG